MILSHKVSSIASPREISVLCLQISVFFFQDKGINNHVYSKPFKLNKKTNKHVLIDD